MEKGNEKKGIKFPFQIKKSRTITFIESPYINYPMHDKCKSNIHRVTVAKWLEYSATEPDGSINKAGHIPTQFIKSNLVQAKLYISEEAIGI